MMELELSRTYLPDGTNGELKMLLCSTIELPWLHNQRNVSCIPEGRYKLQTRFSSKHHWHIKLEEVPGRSGILIHPANHALRELRGCIAPVTALSAAGQGTQSRLATEKLYALVHHALVNNEQVFLTIKSKQI